MISVQEALERILSQNLPQESELVDLTDSLGRILAETVRADRDAPPFHRVTMDGIAIDSSVLQENSSFQIENIQAAGQAQMSLSNRMHCLEVMTGAILPQNTDCVVPYEQIKITDGVAFLDSTTHLSYQNIHLKGTDAKEGEVLFSKGQVITPSVVGVLAAVGASKIPVKRLPKIAICSTGDELVDIDQKPEIHQIRRSNAYMLNAALSDLGIKADLFHIRDEKEEMKRELARLVNDYQVLLFSGAVSKGKYDYLPFVLQELKMNKIIHGVAQRPGKPFLFGTLPNTLVFGFPGNPTSTFVCFHTYFKPWLRKHLGLPVQEKTAILDQEVSFNKPLAYHLLVTLRIRAGRLLATPLKNSGSGDLVHLSQADAVITLPPEKDHFYQDEVYPLNPLSQLFS